jgi:hypothetical protein
MYEKLFLDKKLVVTSSHQPPPYAWHPKVTPSKLSHHLELLIHEQIPHALNINFWSCAPFLEIQVEGLGLRTSFA